MSSSIDKPQCCLHTCDMAIVYQTLVQNAYLVLMLAQAKSAQSIKAGGSEGSRFTEYETGRTWSTLLMITTRNESRVDVG